MGINQYIEANGLKDPQYLGDGVYVAHDGYQVWLLTMRFASPVEAIALPPSELASLISYWKRTLLGD